MLHELQLAPRHEMHQYLGLSVKVVQLTNGRVGHLHACAWQQGKHDVHKLSNGGACSAPDG